MFKLQATKKFLRKYIKLIKRNPELEERFDMVFTHWLKTQQIGDLGAIK